MNRRFALVIAALLTHAWSQSATETWTLKKCYEKALTRNEALGIAALEEDKARAQKNQTFTQSLPSLSYRHNFFFQEQFQQGGVGGAFTQSYLPEGAFNVRLPLFRGYSEWVAVKGAKNFMEQRRQEKKFIELQTYANIASLYSNILLFQKNIELVDRALVLTRDRHAELLRFVRLGRARRSELLELENQLNLLESEKLDTLKLIQNSQNTLESLVGEPVGPLAPFDDVMAKKPASIEAVNLKERHDILARKAGVDVAKATVKAQLSRHLPGVDSNFNYYTERSGIRDQIDWDLSVGVEMPLFAFGNTHYAVREAKASLKQAELALKQTEREALLEIKSIWDELEIALKKMPILKKSLNLTRENYDLQTKEYRYGMVTNFQVLDALSKLHDAELAYQKLELETSFQVIRLILAQGQLP